MSTWRISNFYGGISTGSKKGIGGSYYFMKGGNTKTDPDLLQANLALEKASGVSITNLPKWFAHFDNAGTITYFAYDAGGKIYSDASTWTSLRTVASAHGQGLAVFGNYLYYAQDAALGRYGDLTGSPSFTDAYQTLTSDTDWHPCKVFLNLLCVGNSRTLATLDSTLTWNASAITLPLGWKIKSLEVRGDFLYIGAWKGNAVTSYEQGALFAWDGTSTTWNSVEFINESGVNAMLNYNDTLYVWAGTRGNIYQVSGGKFYKIKRIPFIGDGKYADVYPGAVTGFNGMVHFGMGVTDSATLYQGVYTWGQIEKNYPMVLNYEYPVSIGNTQGAGLSIGAVYAASPVKLFTGWRYANTITMSIANPCVVTLATHGFADGTPIMFTTTGALPTGITASTYYYAKSTGTNTFNLYDTEAHAIAGGTTGRVTTTGTQSGTHTGSNNGIDLISTSTTQTSVVLETLIYDANDLYHTKVAKRLKLVTAPFTSTESITVKYKADRATSWTTLGDTTEPFETTGFINMPFIDPTSGSPGYFRFREIQLQFTLTNGAKLIEACLDFSYDGTEG